MARLPRLVIPHQVHYLSQQGHDRQPVFRDSDDYVAYLAWLLEAGRKFGVAIHAYVLLPENIDLLITPSDEEGPGKMMQWIGRYYVPYFNRKYKRTGTLWSSRYQATVIEAQGWFLECCRYMEMRPVLESAAAEPVDYRWSSYAHHAGIQTDPLLTDHPQYWQLGNTPFEREAAYRQKMERGMSRTEIDHIGAAVRGGWPLGSKEFKQELEKRTQRRMSPGRRGRPPAALSLQSGKTNKPDA